MILTIMTTLKGIWTNIAPYVAGISIGGMVSCGFYCLFKFSFNKALNKIDTNKMENKCINAAKQEVKETTFKVSIQPIVQSEIKKATEEITEYSKKELLKSNNDLSQRLDKLTNVVIALGNYFDDSIGVSDTKKQAFKEAVNELNDISTSIKEDTEKEAVVEQLEVLPNIEVKQNTNDNTIIR